MKLNRGFQLLSLFGVLGVAVAGGQELVQEAIPDWPAPATWSLSRVAGLHTLANITSPLPFIGVTPCRVADTRGNGFTGGYGPPALVANATRSFTITGQCGIPASAAAVSFNFGALNVGGGGDLRVFPAGGSVPLASTLNYNANTPNIANAAIVPLGTGGAITVQADAVSIDLIIDLNGYYAPAGVGAADTFLGHNAGNFTMTGDFNTATGAGALSNNTTGSANTANGAAALSRNNTGFNNTASGEAALTFNTMGVDNTANGSSALSSNTTGGFNTASGTGALASNTISGENTAIGADALGQSTGSSNIGIGSSAGFNLTTGDSNICIGNSGVAGEASTTRIGTNTSQTRAFIAGVNGVMTGGTGTPVLIDSNGQLGTVSSSARFKDDIQDMGEATERLLKLRPVTFRYKAQPEGRTQFGLIGEEVESVMPELVVCSSSGEVETVLYHEMPAMLLNELQKQQREIQALKAELSALRALIGQK
jgi:Chaperone of endosialidase